MIGPILSCADVSLYLVGVVITSLFLLLIRSRPRNLPPSPGLALPFIGHLYMLKRNPRKLFQKWADRYGDVYALQMGSQTTVFINTFEAMNEAFVKKAEYFSDRSGYLFIMKHSPHYNKGTVFSSGPNWKAQRKVSLAILRKFGMGKNILAEKIKEEVSCFIEELASKTEKPFDIRFLTNMSVFNVICSIIFGKRFEFHDPKFIQMMQLVNESLKINNGVLILNFLPCLFYLPFDLFKGKRLIDIYQQMRSFTSEMLQQTKKHYVPDRLDNLTVAYIDEMMKEQQSGEHGYLDEINLSRNIDNLLIAGSDTINTTILWCLLYALNYPDVQKKIFHEIMEHVGIERLPNITDRSKMKYLTAFIMEVQRMASIVPLSVPHMCHTDTTVCGYTIPKGAVVLPNLDAVLRSKEIWGDPEAFRPERFLDEHGNIVKREELIPFSIGRRVCLGESLANMELFLYLSTMFQRFEFLPPSQDKIPPLTETFGGVAAPEPFEIRCLQRI